MSTNVMKIVTNVTDIGTTKVSLNIKFSVFDGVKEALMTDLSSYKVTCFIESLESAWNSEITIHEISNALAKMTISSLTEGTTYKIKIKATSLTGNASASSANFIFTTKAKQNKTAQTAQPAPVSTFRRVNNAYLKLKNGYKQVVIYNNIKEE